MVKDKRVSSKLFDVANIIIMGIAAFTCLYPLWYAFCLSISSKAAANSGLVTIFPIGVTAASYKEIMGDSAFFNSFWISIQRTLLGTVFTMLVLIMIAYPLSKTTKEFKPKSILMWIVIFCMLFNGGTIPWYITVKNYNMIDSIWGLVLAGSLPVFNLIIMINFFKSLPADLEEAAVVDGAGPWRILFQIVVPCSVPVLATVVLLTGVGYWNEFFQGLVLSTGEAHYPLQTYIKQMVVTVSTSSMTKEQIEKMSTLSNNSLNAAKVFIAMLPMLVIYPFLQRYFVNGIMLGAVKE